MIAFDENDAIDIDIECEEYLGEREPKDFLNKDKRRFKRRKTDWKKASRKRKIAKEVYSSCPESTWEWYDNLHQYSKNKIHCSCPICSTKTNNRNRWGKRYDPPTSDKKKIEKINYGIKEEIE